MSNEFEAIASRRRPLLIVLSAPSGAGKTTLIRRWLASDPTLAFSVSCTTRPPRPGERHGQDYFFLSEAEFAERIARGDFLEHAEVHGRRYGTLRAHVLEFLRAGRDVIMDIDVQGAATIRRQARGPDTDPLIREGFVDIFIAPPTEAALEARLAGRGTETAADAALRLRNAVAEMAHWRRYQYCVVNDDLETAFQDLCAIRRAEKLRTAFGLATGAEAG
jgi:guanylate kinase